MDYMKDRTSKEKQNIHWLIEIQYQKLENVEEREQKIKKEIENICRIWTRKSYKKIFEKIEKGNNQEKWFDQQKCWFCKFEQREKTWKQQNY